MMFKDKVVIVTGGSKGIGQTYTKAFAKEGAKVVIADIDTVEGKLMEAKIKTSEGSAMFCKTDVSDSEQVDRMVKETLQAFGKIDILLNNAAMYSTLEAKSFDKISAAEFKKVLDVNVVGMFICIKAVFPAMQEKGKGKIINISSNTFFKGTIHLSHYVASKGAVIGLTRSLAKEMGKYGINVNAVCPGLTDSGTNSHTVPEGYFEQIASISALGKRQLPQDLVGTVLFLASEQSDFITGQTIVVDGGQVFS